MNRMGASFIFWYPLQRYSKKLTLYQDINLLIIEDRHWRKILKNQKFYKEQQEEYTSKGWLFEC